MRFNIYGGPKVGYFSPEPWFGLTNSLNLGKPLVNLEAGNSWTWRLQLKATGLPPESPRSAGVEKVRWQFRLHRRSRLVERRFSYLQRYVRLQDHEDDEALSSRDLSRRHQRPANGNAMDVQGRSTAAASATGAALCVWRRMAVSGVASPYEGKRLNDPNDVVVRRDGQVYFSDPAPKDSLQHFELGYAGVYHVTS